MEAVLEGIAGEMRRDERVFMIGQDIGAFGGAMQSASGLFAEFGPERIRESPISESAMVGIGIGAALFGRRPIVDISFGEFLPAAMNQLINQAPNIHYMTAGRGSVPLVIRTRMGDGPYGGHPQDYSSWFAHIPGLKVVVPARSADAKGLMIAAIRDNNPVLFIEPMSVSHASRQPVPSGDYVTPIGSAEIARAGSDVTIVTFGSMVPVTLRAAETLAAAGIDVEVVDLRSLRPWDVDVVIASVRKTGRLLEVQEAWIEMGFGAEVLATVAERAVGSLKVAPARIGAAPVPIPTRPLRRFALPEEATIVSHVTQLVRAAEG
jgi:pyruvate dehydrogenase E1 component beta subunit